MDWGRAEGTWPSEEEHVGANSGARRGNLLECCQAPKRVVSLSEYRRSWFRTGWIVLAASVLAGCFTAGKTAGPACSTLVPTRWGALSSEARWSQIVVPAVSHVSLHSADWFADSIHHPIILIFSLRVVSSLYTSRRTEYKTSLPTFLLFSLLCGTTETCSTRHCVVTDVCQNYYSCGGFPPK
jgi:hypothetical protein